MPDDTNTRKGKGPSKQPQTAPPTKIVPFPAQGEDDLEHFVQERTQHHADIEEKRVQREEELRRKQAEIEAAEAEREAQKGRPAFERVNLAECSGQYYLNETPKVLPRIMQGLPVGTLGAIVGPAGVGKSTSLIQLACAAGAGLPWLDIFDIMSPQKVLILSGEDERSILHDRVKKALFMLPERYRAQAAANVVAVPLRGRMALIQETAGEVMPSANYGHFLAMLDEIQPSIVIMDTLSKFIRLSNENDNSKMQTACDLLDGLCEERKLSILLSHHVNKASARLPEDEASLAAQLDASSSRGSYALTGAVRWQVNMGSLSAKLAKSVIGTDAGSYNDGHFLAIKISKSNYGPLSEIHYMDRDAAGLLRKVEAIAQEGRKNTIELDTEYLVGAVKDRAAQGLPPLSFSKGITGNLAYAENGIPWGLPRYQKARDYGVSMRLLKSAKKEKGNGEILALF